MASALVERTPAAPEQDRELSIRRARQALGRVGLHIRGHLTEPTGRHALHSSSEQHLPLHEQHWTKEDRKIFGVFASGADEMTPESQQATRARVSEHAAQPLIEEPLLLTHDQNDPRYGIASGPWPSNPRKSGLFNRSKRLGK